MSQSTNASFVHPFRTPKNCYLYDVNTNSVVQVSDSVYAHFTQKAGLSAHDDDIISKLKADGYLKPNPIERIDHPQIPLLSYILSTKVQGITLQITQQCNLRCKYCIYSGGYESRGHSSKSMDLKTAKKGIDFVIECSSGMDEITIGFYGGEPLLQFDLMKKCVEYAVVQAEGKMLALSVTTNGTLFTDEILDFLDKYHFSVSLSLDGPREIQDANRVFARNGKGTFDTIMTNLRHIREAYPSVFSRIIISSVADPSLDVFASIEFFRTCDELEGVTVQSSNISGEYRKDKVSVPEKFLIDEERDMFLLLMSKLKRIPEDRISKMSEDKFGSLYMTMYEARPDVTNLAPVMHPPGQCIPGTRKLFMTVDGSFYPCEKVSETSPYTRIGHVDTGYDLDAVKRILNLGALTPDECKNCWSILMCSICVVSVDDPQTGLSRRKKLALCPGIRRSNELMLKNFCTLKERGFSFSGLEKSFLLIGRQVLV